MIELVNATNWGSEITLHHPGGKRSVVRGTYDLYTQEGSSFKRHMFRTSGQRRDFEAELRSRGVTPYEADVSPIRRWLCDHQSEIKIAKPDAGYLDFEADSRATIKQQVRGQARVLCWSWLGKEDGKLQTGLLPADNDHDEAHMLLNLWKAIRPYDQVLAWSGGMVEWDILKSQEAKHGYDFYVLIRRSAALGVLPKGWERILFLDHLSVFKKNNLNSGERKEKTSFKLQDIGMAKVGRGKTEFDSKHTWEAWAAGGKQRENLLTYNIGDVELERDIELATDYLSVFQAACEVTLNFPDTVSLQPSRQVDGLMLAYGARRGIHFPTKPRHTGEDSKTKAFAGAFVDGPYVNGIEENVHVADFKALYPSIIISLNVSPETLGRPGSTAPIDQESLDKYGVTEPVTFDTSVTGILPECLIDMMRLREEWRKRAKEFPTGSPEEAEAARKSMAFKVINNSFFGVVCSPYSRYFDVRSGLAITRTGVTLIKKVHDEVAHEGWKNLYSDTDSVQIKGPDVPDAMRGFVRSINENVLPNLATHWGCKENRFYLDYEKSFSKLVFTRDPETGYNAKKYFYRLAQKGGVPPKLGSEIGWTGIELKRGDSTALAAELLERVVRMIMAPETPPIEEFEKLIEAERLRVMHTQWPREKIQITKSVKELDTYANDTAPQFVAANMMQERGVEMRDGDKVSWIVTCGSPSHPEYQGKQKIMLAEDYTGTEADMYYVWETCVFPATYRVLAGAFPDQVRRFDRFLAPKGAAAVHHVKLERAGQLRIGIL